MMGKCYDGGMLWWRNVMMGECYDWGNVTMGECYDGGTS